MLLVAPEDVVKNAARDGLIQNAHYWCVHCGMRPLSRREDLLRYTYCPSYIRLFGVVAYHLVLSLGFAVGIGCHDIQILTPVERHRRFGCFFVPKDPEYSEAGSYCVYCRRLRHDDDQTYPRRFE